MENNLYSLRNGFKKARKRKGHTQQQVADIMGVTLKTVMNWEQGVSNPDLETTMKLAELFDCDLDSLAGKIQERTHDIKTACELTGLSEAAIEKIRGFGPIHPNAKTLSRMIESDRFDNFITTYKMFLTFLSKLTAADLDDQLPWYELNDNNVVLGVNQSISHFKQEVSLAMIHICDDNYAKQVSQAIQDIDYPFTLSVEPGKYTIHRGEE